MYSYQYPRPAMTVDAIILKKESNQLLLIQRAKDPFAGKWALPGGFVDMDELLEIACKRELKEETGLEISFFVFFTIADKIDRDPRGRTISAVYYGFAPEDATVEGRDDAAGAEWFSLDNLPELAFDHAELITSFKQKIVG